MATKTSREDIIIEKYMNFVLEHEMVPKSIYKFCKANKIKEEEFYNFFGSIDSIQKTIWSKFLSNTIEVIDRNKDYKEFSNRDKLLTFFFTFFEMLTLNRSYVLFILNNRNGVLENMSQIKDLRVGIKAFSKSLITNSAKKKNPILLPNSSKIFSEGIWFQFLFLLKFWMKDTSAGFEKTDIAIEKSVNTIFDVFNTTPLENILDFGKFLYKEKFA